MRQAGALARRRRRWVLSHIAETREEVRRAAARFDSRSIARLYDDCGLLTPRSLLAHGVWLEPGELELLRRRRSWIVHCPTSNAALGSGRMPLEALRRWGVRWCLASDVGAGPRLSLLDVMREALEVHRHHARLDPAEAYYRATLAGAEALGWGRGRGALEVGRRADCVVVEGEAFRSRTAAGVVREWIERGGGVLWLAGRPGGAVSP
ncbi:MAG: amidohydrolase family protein [Acidobacteriota bacterium]|nr:amidohydrolase family protein [Acidobacteriota bacterium]